MPGKLRVHELAKQLGITSKELLNTLKEQGEFVKTASSTIQPPVIKKMRAYYEAKNSTEGDAAEQTNAAGSGESQKTAPTPTKPASSKPGASEPSSVPKPGALKKPGSSQATPKSVSAASAPMPSAKTGSSAVPKPGAPTARSRTASKTDPTFMSAHRPGDVPKPGARPGATPARPVFKQAGEEAAPSGASRTSSSPSGHSGNRPAPKPGASAHQTSATAIPRPQAKPGPKPGARSPRVANNPFSTNRPAPRPGGGRGAQASGHGQGQHGHGSAATSGKPGARTGGNRRQGAPKPGQGGQQKSRSGHIPTPSMMPSHHPSPGQMPTKTAPGGRGGRSGGRGNAGGNQFNGAPNAGGRGGFGGRSGRRGGTAGAFGRPGGAPRRGRKSKRQKRSEYEAMKAPNIIGGIHLPDGGGKTIRLRRGASLADFAEKIGTEASSLVQALFNLGEMVTATASVSEDLLILLGDEINYKVEVVSPEDEDRELLESFDLQFGEDEGGEEDLENRPPVVTVMGHVDHGKTRLLDTIRQTNVGAQESGGITQIIGAYQVTVEVDDQHRKITFLDTPGHEAFTAMRARGAQSTDIAILVVAADDGVMPQTVEAINHAKAAGVPIVVAVNKIDKPGADPQKIRGQLTEYGLVPEEYGGDTMFVDISAKKNHNVDKLLEAVLLTADAALDLRANPNMDAQGVSIESHLDRGRGPVATVLVQRGTLHVGDSVVVGDTYGRVRRMTDENGHDVEEAGPSRPVQMQGLNGVPGAGDNLLVVEDDRMARQIAQQRDARKRSAMAAKQRKRVSLEDLDAVLKETSTLNLILKGDNAGSVEALEEALLKIEAPDEVELNIIDRGVGAVTQTNVSLASASDAIILGFNVRAEGKATEEATNEGVEIRYYTVIYDIINDVEAALKGMLKPIYEERALGTAEIRQLFKSSAVGTIAGCMVESGKMRRNATVRLVRDGKVIADKATIDSLRRGKDDATEVKSGYECGMVLSYPDISVGDQIEAYEMVEVPRT